MAQSKPNHDNDIVLEVEGVTKQFPGVLANDDVNLKLRRGEILALLGENGAGKSTLMNVIYGLYHPDKGTIRLKGREVRFASPREAIHSGIGMVHQHFQLVDVMTVAENVMLGEESTVAYRGRTAWQRWVLKWLPSIVLFALSVIIGLALEQTATIIGGVAVGLALGAAVAVPPAARMVWGMAWRVGLALAAIAIASQVQQVTRVAITDIALRQEVEIVREKKPKEMDGGYTVKRTVVKHQRIEFDWAKEYRDAGGIDGVVASAKEQLEAYRDDGVPGWLIDAIDDVPPVAEAVTEVLLLVLIGWHSIASWRGIEPVPGRLRRHDLALLGGLLLVYVIVAFLYLDSVGTLARIVLFVLMLAGLGLIAWRTYTMRQRGDHGRVPKPSPLDGALDAFLFALNDATQIRNMQAAAQRVRELSQQYGLEVDPDAVVEKLPVGAQQRVEIIKALYRQADILILDEPTAVLTPQEGRELFKIMRELAAQGVSIIFITHKLKEVFEVATNIVVMRGGRVVGTTTPDQATETSLAAMMVGREVILQVEKGEAHPAAPVLEVDAVSAIDDRGAQALRDVSFTVRAGEVLGIAGVQGNGQTELVEVLTGLREPTSGSVRLLGVELKPDRQPPGGLGARVAAFVLDTLAVALLAYFAGYFVWYFRNENLGASLAVVVAVIVDALYFLGGWLWIGGTLGMSLFGLAVVDRADHRPGSLKLAQRYLVFLALRLPAFVPLLASVIRARGDAEGRCWFDRWLGLRVIHRERITPRRIKDLGSSHVPEDRLRHGLVKPYTVADNLVLNDFYERPYAKEPNLAELPASLLRYWLIVGGVIGVLTVISLYVWDQWLWTVLLDAYNVPAEMREIGRSLSRAQKAALQYPLIISALLLLVAELIYGVLGHLVAIRVLGLSRVQALIRQLDHRMLTALWRILGREGEPANPAGGLLRDEAAIERHALDLIEEYDIRTPGPHIDGGNLSGGNQQKLIVAREFSRRPRLLIAAQPTRGIDVGSIEFIHKRIIEQRDEGAAVLLVSAELDEIMALSDRIAVLYKGEIIDTLPAAQASREQLGLLMAGIQNNRTSGAQVAAEPAPA